jgi:oligopeptide/dipeptide ABC transporter ATP-binding protein
LILDLLDELRERLGLGILFITHDLVLAASRADDVLVLHSGRLVERMPAKGLFDSAAMPYTRDLIARVPGADRSPVGPVLAPTLQLESLDASSGCHYTGECAMRQEICAERVPTWVDLSPEHVVRCWFPIGHSPIGSDQIQENKQKGVSDD